MLFTHLVTQVEVSPSRRALLHLPTPFPPAFLQPLRGPSFAAQGASKLTSRDMVVGRGAEEKTGAGRIVISYQNSRKQR